MNTKYMDENLDRKLRILFIGSNYSLKFQKWVEWFIEKGHSVGIIGKVKNYQQSATFYNMSYPKRNTYQKTSLIGYLVQLYKIRKSVRNFKPDIIHSHSVTLYGIFINLLNFHPNVISLWGSDVLILPKESSIIAYFVKLALKRCDLITTESTQIAKVCMDLGISKDKIKLVQFGIDSSSYRIAKDVILDVDLNSNHIIIFPRGLSQEYNPDILIKSIPLVVEKYPDVLFVFKYYDIRNNEENLEKLNNLLNEYDVKAKNYRFIGELPYLELLKLFSMSKIYVSIPSSDSISMSLIEGMIMGCVPVVSDLPANREIVTNNGKIVPLTAMELSKAIIEILSNYSMWEKQVENLNDYLLKKFDKDMNMKNMENLYRGLLN